MTNNIVRKAHTGEPTENGGHFGTVNRPEANTTLAQPDPATEIRSLVASRYPDATVLTVRPMPGGEMRPVYLTDDDDRIVWGRGIQGIEALPGLDQLIERLDRTALIPREEIFLLELAEDAAYSNPEGYTHFAGGGEEHGVGDIVDIDGNQFVQTDYGMWRGLTDNGEVTDEELGWDIDKYDRTLVSTRTDRNAQLLAELPADRPVGYMYKAELHTSDNLATALEREGNGAGVDDFDDFEDFLNIWAANTGVDRNDEYTFDSDNFPKQVFKSELDAGDDLSWLSS